MGQQGVANIGVTGLAVMGRNLARNLARHGHTVALHNRTNARTESLVAQHGDEGTFVPSTSMARVRRVARAPARGDHHGQGRRADRRGHRGTRPADGRRRHHHRLRQRALHGHPPARGSAARAGHPLRRLRGVRRRRGRAARAVDHAGRFEAVLREARPDLRVDRGAGRRHPVLRARRPRRRRALREDGAQRHRVRRHAADRRGLRPAARRARRVAGRDRRDLQVVERGRPRVVPDRDHRGRARPGRQGDRPAVRRHRARPGRAEGHRPLDGAERARPRHPDHRHRRGDVRPRAVRPRRAARAGARGVRLGARPAWTPPIATGSSRTSGARCTPRRSSPTRRASTTSRPAAPSTTGTSTVARWPRSGAAAASSAPAS